MKGRRKYPHRITPHWAEGAALMACVNVRHTVLNHAMLIGGKWVVSQAAFDSLKRNLQGNPQISSMYLGVPICVASFLPTREFQSRTTRRKLRWQKLCLTLHHYVYRNKDTCEQIGFSRKRGRA